MHSLYLCVHKGLCQWCFVSVLSPLRCWGEEKEGKIAACSEEAHRTGTIPRPY